MFCYFLNQCLLLSTVGEAQPDTRRIDTPFQIPSAFFFFSSVCTAPLRTRLRIRQLAVIFSWRCGKEFLVNDGSRAKNRAALLLLLLFVPGSSRASVRSTALLPMSERTPTVAPPPSRSLPVLLTHPALRGSHPILRPSGNNNRFE